MNPHALPSGHSFWTSNPFTAMSIAAELGGLAVDRYHSGQYMHGMYDSGRGWFGYGILSPRGGFLVIDWHNRKVSYKEDAERMTPAFKFNVGDKVVYTNEYGVCWGVKTITSLEPPLTEGYSPRYHYEGSDTPWYSVEEERFTLADAEDLLWAKDSKRHDMRFQKKYGFPTTAEQRAALLDNDPFDGET